MLFENARLLEKLVDDLDETSKLKGGTKAKSITRDAYEVAVNHIILEKALSYYNELIDSFPNSESVFRELNNKGLIEFDLGKDSVAERTFSTLLNSNAKDTERGGPGIGLMAEPYTNYKNRAAELLAEMNIRQKKYAKALEYLELTKKFPYQHFCGNALETDAFHLKYLYASCYIGMNKYSEAYKLLLPYVINHAIADETAIVELACKALLVNYKKNQLKRQFQFAVNQYKPDTLASEDILFKQFFIEFLGIKIPFEVWNYTALKSKLSDREIDRIIKQQLFTSKFYKLLSH